IGAVSALPQPCPSPPSRKSLAAPVIPSTRLRRRRADFARVPACHTLLHCESQKQSREGFMLYGYARVSTRDQDHGAQVAELKAAGCDKIFSEQVSGARSDRPQLARALRRLDACDVLMVTRLDRLARSTRDLLNVLDQIGKRGAGFRSLRDAWADTTTP